MLTMIHDEPARPGLFSELDSQSSNEYRPCDREELTCPLHPGNKFQVLCPKDNFYPPLLCIKCMIDPEIERRTRNEPLIAIHEIINNALSASSKDSFNERNRTLLRDKLMTYYSAEYLGAYESHTEVQMKKLHREIERVRESLNELENRFKDFFNNQHKSFKNREDALIKKIEEYFEDQDRIENLTYSSRDSVMETIRKANNVKECARIIKALYEKGTSHHGSMGGSSMLNGIFDMMDELKEKNKKMMNCKISTAMLDEIRQKIDLVEPNDQSATLMGNLSPKLMKTLEKVRAAEEKRKTPQKEIVHQAPERYTQRKADPLRNLKDKLADFGKKNTSSQKQMEIEVPSFRTHHVDEKRTSRSPYQSQSAVKTDEKKQTQASAQKRGKENTTQMYNMANAGMNASPNDEHRLNDDEERMHRRQKVDAESYRRVSETKNRETERKREDQLRREYEYFGSHQKEERVNEYSAYPQSQQTQVIPTPPKSHLANDETNQRSSKKYSEGTQNYGSQGSSQRNSSLHTWLKQDLKEKTEDKPKKRSGTKEKSRKKEQNAEGEDDKGESSGKRARVKGLHDWINRRVTGYLVFQNTIHDIGLEKEREGDHLNRVAGEKWKGLSKGEKEEYKGLALKARINLKKEFQDVDIEDPHIKELQEIVEKRLKKVKKDY